MKMDVDTSRFLITKYKQNKTTKKNPTTSKNGNIRKMITDTRNFGIPNVRVGGVSLHVINNKLCL